MKLHHDIKLLSDTLRAASQHLDIKLEFVEKEITAELKEVPTEGITSKGSRFRKSVFEYKTVEKSNANNKLIIEINSFANPFPFKNYHTEHGFRFFNTNS